MKGDLGEAGEAWGEFIPKPFEHDFEGGVFEAWGVVEGGVV